MKALLRKLRPNPLDKILKAAKANGKKRFLVLWNRGLGDIPLGLYALVVRIREYMPDAEITFLTRKDLEQVFTMLNDVKVIVSENMVRGKEAKIDVDLADYDVVLEKPDPTRWLAWQLGTLVPKLEWNEKWDLLSRKYGLSENETYIGAHIQTETGVYYGYEKNWLFEKWMQLFEKIENEKIILFGMQSFPEVKQENVIDLRGETSLFEMLSVIKNYCRYMLAPDSGVLSIAYYLNMNFPLRFVSLWSDPKQGVLRQNVASPNQLFEHIPIIGDNNDLSSVTIDHVYDQLHLESANAT